MNILTPKKKIHLFLIYFIVNFAFIELKYKTYNIVGSIIEKEIGNLYIEYINVCDKWIPSLLFPILLVPKDINVDNLGETDLKISKNNIFLVKSDAFQAEVYSLNFLEDQFKVYLGREIWTSYMENCYFGLSPGIANFTGINENQNIINLLKEEKKIDNPVFSFSKLDINKKSINSKLFFGDFHENFIDNKLNVGSCQSDKSFWSCTFKEIIFNNKIIPLTDINGQPYQIFFTTESYNIVFPKSFQQIFIEKSDGKCFYNILEPGLSCYELFNEKYFIPLKLIYEDMNITGEIDNIDRYNTEIINKRNNTRIKFENIDFIILPLIMFKEFHVQFDASNHIISFFSTDKSILEVKNPNSNNDSSSITFTKFLVILIIIIILISASIIFLILKRKDLKVEKSINKFSKLEEEEDFHNMNENRVF